MQLYVSMSKPLQDIVPKDSSEAQFKMFEEDVNKRLTKLHLEDGNPVTILGKKMFSLNSNLGHSICMIKDNCIVYLVIYHFEHHAVGRIFVQDLVWSDATSVQSGFARKLMLSYFLDKYGTIGTSETQRDFGIQMWISLILSALTKKLYVYVTNLNDELGSLTPVKTAKQLRSMYSQIWGSDPVHKNRKVLISKSPLLD